MTKSEAVREFNATIKLKVLVQYGENDKPAMSEAWGVWTDTLCKDGVITERQYESWVNPF